ncbi:MAG: lytic transglycosylase domain-containing protein, partial [Armatimonadetes bacterium]|nr:lytic transglycosylase domain-containing protein [Armatimonadota bacterium]
QEEKPHTSPKDPKSYLATRQTRGINLSSRAMEVLDPYRRAIARFNPRLSQSQLDTITTSILAFSEKYGVDPRLVVAIFLVESGFNPAATSRCGAMGIGQLMPGTARGLGVINAYDPVQNIEGSIKLISGHLAKYGDLALALSAYNAGPGAVRKYNGVPPYRETQNYVKKVSAIYRALCGK